MAEQREAVQETSVSIGADISFVIDSGATRHSYEFKCVTEKFGVMAIMGISLMKWTSKITVQRRRAVNEKDTRQRAWHFDADSRSVNNVSLREQISVRTYQSPSANTFVTPETPSEDRMSLAINKYSSVSKNKALV